MRFFDLTSWFVLSDNRFVEQARAQQRNGSARRVAVLAAIAVSVFLTENAGGQTVTHSARGTHKTVNQQQQTKSEKPATSDEKQCDFSAYKPAKISDFFAGNSMVKQLDAIYPPLAIQARIEGEVSTRILVDRKGNVVRACAVTGHPVLRKAAVVAALGWKFKPWCSLCPKDPVVEGEINFHFSLEQNNRKLK